MDCRIAATLGSGLYSITLRLESRRSPALAFPIHKQVSALLFDIVQPDPTAFQGCVDLGLQATISVRNSVQEPHDESWTARRVEWIAVRCARIPGVR